MRGGGHVLNYLLNIHLVREKKMGKSKLTLVMSLKAQVNYQFFDYRPVIIFIVAISLNAEIALLVNGVKFIEYISPI